MSKKILVNLVMVLLVSGLVFTVSCAKKCVVSEPAEAQVETQDQSAEAQAAAQAEARTAAERQKAIAEEQIREESERRALAAKKAEEKTRFENRNIHFAYDSSELTPEARAILKKKADWMRNNPGVTVVVEGHCDERGSTEYNLALGERRALAARQYLVDIGISASRLGTISYGEEKPLDPAHTPSAWDKNRRAQFKIQ
ncbi:MAG: peptidoglycan-associated lipoprotein Pal [Desulfobacteraceae bacterium]